jgi:hypothetical protein
VCERSGRAVAPHLVGLAFDVIGHRVRVASSWLAAVAVSLAWVTPAVAGTTWLVVKSPTMAGPDPDLLSGVSCGSPTFCVAVGTGENRAMIEGWNGVKWTFATSPKGAPLAQLSAVDCTSVRSCWAVGVNGSGGALFEYWNGSEWRAVSGPAGKDVLTSVSCVSARFCAAVGESGNRSVVMLWQGRRWTVSRYLARYAAVAVSCLSSSFCQAVGVGSDSTPYASSWNGSRWVSSHPVTAVRAGFSAVSCWSTHGCVAVGSTVQHQNAPEHVVDGLVERWNGRNWARSYISSAVGPATYLNGVNCASSHCVAVGSAYLKNKRGLAPLVSTWEGHEWQSQVTLHVAVFGELNGVAMRGGRGVAVGDSGTDRSTLIEQN